MELSKNISLPTAFGLSLLLAGTLPPTALAEEEEVEELVVIGTRAQPRSVMDSSVPIDVIDNESLIDQGSSDMNFMLRSLVPSFHVNMQPGRDAAAVQNPINLRGLAPDHTLVLVNGKRRHRGATITWISDGRSNGAQGPDISVIPGIALKQVEVLRDGAAAQYGSDAIAGVMNFVLKDDTEGGELEFRYGRYDEGNNEEKTRVSGNLGMPLAEHGFANVSFEYSSDSPTSRSVLRNDVRGMIERGNTHIDDPAHVWGSPDIQGNLKTFFNLGMDLDADRQVYAFGNYARRKATTGFFYREPEDEAGVFALDKTFMVEPYEVEPYEVEPYDHDNDPNTPDVTTKDTKDTRTYKIPLIYDRTMPESNYSKATDGTCSKYVDDVDDRLTAAGLPPDLEGLLEDDDCFSYHEWFPGGFQPRFGGKVTDYSLVVGLKGVVNRLSYDISASLGENEAAYFLHNSVNPSWGPDSPTSFDLGSYIQKETNLNIDVTYMADVGLASDLNVAAGLEWREEQFEITLGQRESWDKGEYIFSGAKNGSNGFNGFGPTAAGEWDRENVAAYLDLEVDVQPNWTIGGAVRWEDFDNFGTETTAKVSTRIQASEVFALRGSFGTGFRAPTPGQQNAYNISTIFDPITVEPVDSGTIPSNSALAEQFGGKTLEPEESDNFTVGAIFEFDALSITVDYFRIDVEDRIFLSDQIKIQDVTGARDDDGNDISDGKVDGYEHVDFEDVSHFDSIRFFENDFDTKTDGFDVVLTYSLAGDMGDTDFLLSYNRTETEVTKSSNLSGRSKRWLEEGAPETRYSATVNHEMGDWKFLLRYYHFGDWYSDYDQVGYNGYGLTDIGVTRRINSHASASLGADNVLDETPDRSVQRLARGNKYPRFSPGGIDGRFIYARVRLEL